MAKSQALEQYLRDLVDQVCAERDRFRVDLKDLEGVLAQKGPACVWSNDDVGGDSLWETACGHAFEFNDGGPLGNGLRFCGYCSRRLVESLTSEPKRR